MLITWHSARVDVSLSPSSSPWQQAAVSHRVALTAFTHTATPPRTGNMARLVFNLPSFTTRPCPLKLASTACPSHRRPPARGSGVTAASSHRQTATHRRVVVAAPPEPFSMSVLDENLPTLRAPKDCRTTKAVQDWRSKKKVLAAARSVVNITPISEVSGFILDRYEHGGIQFSIVVTCSRFICKDGRKLDPLPKVQVKLLLLHSRTSNHKSSFQFSVGLPDRKTIEAKLFHFSDHYDIAFLLLPMETSLDIPCFGCCPDYSQEVFVLGRDKDASLRVRRGVISWTEESDFIGCSHYMFLDGEVPQGGTGGPVIDHDGNFRGMAFQLEVCDLMKGRRRLITVPVGFCSAPESTSDNEV
ncbi:hypothetical protein PR202_ga18659 [Eleusine coracana subsp. coracana]|uniref:Uncharacterized protein n=1 Tax=Eleusine coracana subsp. coracana TaxID=191504 RepID=A0AAV5CRY4_ELECO|nr:hypothetical protein PR202_ga18659 [Eleusine coracana subsp. coracana]